MSIRHNFGQKGFDYIASFLKAVVASTLNHECDVVESVTISFEN